MRAIWQSWQNHAPLRYDSHWFHLDLMPPQFDPGPNGGPAPAVYLGGVSARWAHLAARVADGFVAHGFNSPHYLRQVVRPALTAAAQGQRPCLVVPVLVAIAEGEADRQRAQSELRRRVAFYASTPSYAPYWALSLLPWPGLAVAGFAGAGG